jgi:PAS domain S-box-containing protein
MCWAADASGSCVYVNQRWLDFDGRKLTEETGDGWSLQIHPDDRPAVLAAWRAAVSARQSFEVVYRRTRADGEYRMVRESRAPTPDGYLGYCRDETDQQREIERLRRASEDLHDFFENAVVPIHWVGEDGTILQANRAELELLGYSAEEYIGHPISEFHADGGAIADILRRLKAGQRLIDYEAPLRCKDGSIKYVAISSNVRRENGRFLHTRCVSRDVSSAREAERALVASEEQLKAVLDAVPANLYRMSLDGHVDYCNAHWTSYSGMSLEQTRLGMMAAVHPEDVEMVARNAALGQASGISHENEMRIRRRDGTYRWHLARTVPVVVNGHLTGWVGANVDIEDRRRREAHARFLADAGALLSQSLEAESMLGEIGRLAVPGIADWCRIDICDDEGQPRLVSSANVHPERMELATAFRQLSDAPTPGDLARLRVTRTGKSELMERTEDLLHSSADDTARGQVLRRLECKSTLIVPIRTDARVWGTVTLATAESGRRLDEQDMVLAEAFAARLGLALENGQLYTNVQATATELTDALKAKDEFLGLVSHELRTPLTLLKGTANVLRRHGDELSSSDRQQGLLDMERGADQLQRIVENMLMLARSDHGVTDDLEPLLLRRVIQSTIADQRAQFPETPVRLNVPHELLLLMGHEGSIRQIVGNLLSNATKYSPPGSAIDVSLERMGEMAVVSVSDRGHGLAAETIEQVFEPFFRAAATTRQAKGIGLGLTVCKRLVERQGGRIWAEARAGGGASFRFTLPLAPTSEDA